MAVLFYDFDDLRTLPTRERLVEKMVGNCGALEEEIAASRSHAAHLLQAVLKEAFSPGKE